MEAKVGSMIQKQKEWSDVDLSPSGSENSRSPTLRNDANKPWWRVFLTYLEVYKTSHEETLAETFLYNQDLKPVERARRKWSWFNFVYVWLSDCFNIKTWQVAATGLQLGLSWWETWLTVWIGYSIVGALVVLTSRAGSNYHISFPIATRASFGIFFSLWPVINRIVIAIVWYAVETWLGMAPVSMMLKSVFGYDLPQRIPNHINNPNTTTYQFMCFFIFWLCQLPFIYVHPHQIRYLFTVKAILVPFAAFGFMIWALCKTNGKIALESLVEGPPLSSSDRGWAWIKSIMACIANFSALIINSPDFSRFAKTRKSSTWSQGLSIPLFFSLTSLVGILVTAAAYELYQVNYWSPMDVLDRFLGDGFTKGERAGAFLLSFIFIIAQLGTNISANSLPAGTDMTALLPRFINIRRGGFICAVLALCICPWDLMSSSNKLTMALSAYAIFLSCIAAIICADYYVVRRGKINLIHLFCADSRISDYMYNNKFGINWRALVAYIAGIVPNMPGFVGTVGDKMRVPPGALKLYHLNYLVGFCISFFCYVILCYFCPVPNAPIPNCLRRSDWLETFEEVETFEDERESFLSANNIRTVVSSQLGGANNDEILSAYEPRNDIIRKT